MTKFIDNAPDVAAFAKNAGPQCLRIDYLTTGGRLAFYTPDFFIRTKQDNYYLVETKGREDKDVPQKARAAVSWCQSASSSSYKWEYLYVPQGIFGSVSADTIEALASTCTPALHELTHEEELKERYPLFALIEPEEERKPEVTGIVDTAVFENLPPRYRKATEQAIMLFRFFENKEDMNYAPVFNALLGSMDEAARGLLLRKLQPDLPKTVPEQNVWFDVYFGGIDRRVASNYQRIAQNLKKTLVFQNGISPLGLLRACMEYALNDNTKIGGVFDSIKIKFKVSGGRALLATVTEINDFRNTYVAHQEQDLTDVKAAEQHLRKWIIGLQTLSSIE